MSVFTRRIFTFFGLKYDLMQLDNDGHLSEAECTRLLVQNEQLAAEGGVF